MDTRIFMLDSVAPSPISSGIRWRIVPNMIFLLALLAISFVPYFSNTISNAIRLGIFTLFALTAPMVGVIKKGSSGYDIMKWWTIFFCLQIFYSLIGHSRELIFFFARCHVYVIPIAMVLVTRFYNAKEVRFLWLCSLVFFAIGLGQNIVLGEAYGEGAFRQTDDMDNKAGTTAFVVACLFLIPTLFLSFFHTSKKVFRYFYLAVIVLGGYYMLFLNTRTTAIVLLILMLGGILFVNMSKKRIKPWQLVAILLVSVVVGYFLLAPSLALLSSFYEDGSRMMRRLDDLMYVADTGSVIGLGEGSLYGRFLLWNASINTFFSSVPNFLFGVGEKYHVVWDVFDRIAYGVGDHSEFFDLAAQYGIIGIIINYNIYKHTFRYVLNITNNARIYDKLIVIFLFVIFYGFVNNITDKVSHVSAIFFFLPITVYLLEYKKI